MEKKPVSIDIIFEAAQNGDLAEVKRLLEEGRSPNSVDTRLHWPLLHFAAAGGHTDTVLSLIHI